MGKFPIHRRFWTITLLLSIPAVSFWQHFLLLTKILLVYPLWSPSSTSLSLSVSRDGLDSSFEKYPVAQWSVRWPPRLQNGSWPEADSSLLRLKDGSLARLPDERYGGGVSYSEPDEVDVVPAVLHHILLGMDRQTMPKSWQASRNSCLALHPESANFTHYFWDDQSAEKFMREHYSFFVRDFLDYRHTIQRADALRYFVLHHYGGIFLDLDLECRRSLGPLRRFPVTNINASPVGVSNGFMMARAKHPFLEQLIRNLKYYDRSWLGIPYADIMFSTGPMFLSSEHLRFPEAARATELRVLGGVEHRLSGRVTTPLFRHLGASSWHQGDAHLLLKVREIVNQWVTSVGLLVLAGGGIGWLLWLRRAARRSADQNRTRRMRAVKAHYLALHPILSGRLVLWRFGLGGRRSRRRGNSLERIKVDLESKGLVGTPAPQDEKTGPFCSATYTHDPKNSMLFDCQSSPTEGGSSSGSSVNDSSDSDDDGSEHAVVVLIDHQAPWSP